jgi:hypothetical protein
MKMYSSARLFIIPYLGNLSLIPHYLTLGMTVICSWKRIWRKPKS